MNPKAISGYEPPGQYDVVQIADGGRVKLFNSGTMQEDGFLRADEVLLGGEVPDEAVEVAHITGHGVRGSHLADPKLVLNDVTVHIHNTGDELSVWIAP